MNRTVVHAAGLGEVVVNHNSDWSGTAIVSWGFAPDPKWPGHEKAAHTVEMPAPLLVSMGRAAALTLVRDGVIRALEQMDPMADLDDTPTHMVKKIRSLLDEGNVRKANDVLLEIQAIVS